MTRNLGYRLILLAAVQALETDARDENSMIPVSMTIAHREINSASQPAPIEAPADRSARVNSVPNQPVTSVDIGEPAP